MPTVDTHRASLARDWLHAARFYLGRRNAILILAAAAIVAGLAFNWSWLVATGVAPILIALLPCAVMCAVGLCFHKLSGASSVDEPPRRSIAADRSEEMPAPSSRAAIDPASNCCGDTTSDAAGADAKLPADHEKLPADDERRDSNV